MGDGLRILCCCENVKRNDWWNKFHWTKITLSFVYKTTEILCVFSKLEMFTKVGPLGVVER